MEGLTAEPGAPAAGAPVAAAAAALAADAGVWAAGADALALAVADAEAGGWFEGPGALPDAQPGAVALGPGPWRCACRGVWRGRCAPTCCPSRLAARVGEAGADVVRLGIGVGSTAQQRGSASHQAPRALAKLGSDCWPAMQRGRGTDAGGRPSGPLTSCCATRSSTCACPCGSTCSTLGTKPGAPVLQQRLPGSSCQFLA